MIVTKNLTVDYDGKNGIFDINLDIPHGSMYALVGHSGCGKTTLLECLAGILNYDSGKIIIKDHKENTTTPGLVQQDDALFPWFKVNENIELGVRTKDINTSKKTNDLLAELNLQSYRDHYPAQLSGGQRQRVSLARTLISDPDVLLLDEPTASLDAFTKESLQKLLLKLYKKKKRTTLFVTHNIEEAVFLAQKILIMDDGKIVSLFDNPLEHHLNLREDPQFYKVVKNIRSLMKDAGSNE